MARRCHRSGTCGLEELEFTFDDLACNQKQPDLPPLYVNPCCSRLLMLQAGAVWGVGNGPKNGLVAGFRRG